MEKEKTLLMLDDWNIRKGQDAIRLLSLPCDILITSRLSPDQWPECRTVCIEAMGAEEWKAVYSVYNEAIVPGSPGYRQTETYRASVQGHTLKTILYLQQFSDGKHDESESSRELDLDSAGI